MSVVIGENNFNSVVMESERPVLIDFWATWCGPCQMISPIIDEFSAENPDVLVCKVNVDDEPVLAQKFGIVSIPTLIAMKDGKIINQLVGLSSKERIAELFD